MPSTEPPKAHESLTFFFVGSSAPAPPLIHPPLFRLNRLSCVCALLVCSCSVLLSRYTPGGSSSLRAVADAQEEPAATSEVVQRPPPF